MTQFIQLLNTFRLAPNSAFKTTPELPAGTYTVKIDREGYYLELISNFELPTKLYGDTTKHTKRIIDTFWDRPNSTGVFLEGEKGSGKTLLSKSICVELLKQNVPTIVINEPHAGEMFNTFLQSISQPKVVFFDEFEKIYGGKVNTDYDEDDQPTRALVPGNPQEKVLTLFDGVYPSKTLFVLTCNDSWKIDKNIKNRPGRMYYMLSFDGLDSAFVREYAEDNLKDKSQIEGLLTVAALFSKFNFDMLKAIVEEMNRYNEPAAEVVKLLNTKPKDDFSEYNVEVSVKGKKVEGRGMRETWRGNPLEGNIVHQVLNAEGRDYIYYMFGATDLKSFDGSSGTFFFLNEKGEEMKLTRKTYEVVDWTKFVA